MWDVDLFPDQASTIAPQIDLMYLVLIALAAAFAFGVAGVLLYFVIRYRAGSAVDRTGARDGNIRIEVLWTVVPLGLAMAMFVWGAVLYVRIQEEPPAEPLEIYAVGRQWMWKFQHANGAREINELHVPTDRPIRLIMTSQDVIHSFYVPAFRSKQDVLPGRFTTAWFEATRPGEYFLFCAEYCGTEHSYMRGRVFVMQPEAYERWLRLGDSPAGRAGDDRQDAERIGGVSPFAAGPGLREGLGPDFPIRPQLDSAQDALDSAQDALDSAQEAGRLGEQDTAGEGREDPAGAEVQGTPGTERADGAPLPAPGETLEDVPGQEFEVTSGPPEQMAAAGRRVFEELRCDTCHRTDSTALQPSIGPVLAGAYGSRVRLRNEREILADEQYLLESILFPQAKLVQGYPPVMPTYRGQIGEMELAQLVAYLKSIGREGSAWQSP